MHIHGACHCGKIRYEADVDPASMSICHCTDCQVLTGSPFRASVRALPNSFRILAGSPRIYTKTAESGTLREQAFCEFCGTPIYATSPGPEPRAYHIRMGSIAERALLTPQLQSWCRSELPWLAQVASVPRLDRDLSPQSSGEP
jgi:hypothetical protein